MVDMKQRTISAIVLLIILIGSLVISSKLFGIVMLLLAILGFNEFFNIKYKKNNKRLNTIRVLGIISLILITLNETFYKIDLKALILIPLITLSIPVVLYNDKDLYNINDSLYVIGIIYFIGLAFQNIVYLRSIDIMKCIFIFIIAFWRVKRIRNGITFLKKWKDDEYMNLLLLNISSAILFIAVILSNYQEGITSKFGVMLIIFAIVMFITIWKSLQLYYKQQMLEKVLEKTQKDLADKTEEVKKLEAENLSFSEISHSIAHRQDSLKHKLEKLSTNTEFADEISINAQIDNITKDLRKKTKIDLEKTGIEIVDDMLDCMQAKCVENNIDFQLQINGNIYHMTNNYIAKED